MHYKSFAGAFAAAAVLTALSIQPAAAFGYRHHHNGGDPYAYRYEPRGYYPYYSSNLWRPAHKVRRRPGITAPPYYQAWGYRKRSWRHRAWHNRNHGRHRLWQW